MGLGIKYKKEKKIFWGNREDRIIYLFYLWWSGKFLNIEK